MKHEKNSRVTYYGKEFKNSIGHGYIVSKVYKGEKSGNYYHDLKSINPPKPVKYFSPKYKRTDEDRQHSEVLLSIEYGDLVKL